MRTSLIIPTRNASSHLARLLPALKMQTLQPDEMLVVDSASSDDTVARFREFGARVEVIDARDFNHGGTRRWASEQVGGDALIVMTQDAIPANPETFANLIAELQQDPLNGVAYGRQLPHPGAGVLGALSGLLVGPCMTAPLAGALLTLLADLAARELLYPAELPVGVITSLAGAPFFLYLLTRKRPSHA